MDQTPRLTSHTLYLPLGYNLTKVLWFIHHDPFTRTACLWSEMKVFFPVLCSLKRCATFCSTSVASFNQVFLLTYNSTEQALFLLEKECSLLKPCFIRLSLVPAITFVSSTIMGNSLMVFYALFTTTLILNSMSSQLSQENGFVPVTCVLLSISYCSLNAV